MILIALDTILGRSAPDASRTTCAKDHGSCVNKGSGTRAMFEAALARFGLAPAKTSTSRSSCLRTRPSARRWRRERASPWSRNSRRLGVLKAGVLTQGEAPTCRSAASSRSITRNIPRPARSSRCSIPSSALVRRFIPPNKAMRAKPGRDRGSGRRRFRARPTGGPRPARRRRRGAARR